MNNTPEFLLGKECYNLRLPWMCKGAIYWLNDNLKKNFNCIEFGSGGSTLFLQERINNIDTFEADKKWYELLIKNNNDRKINYNYCKNQKKLLKLINNINKNYYDICIIDIGSTLKNRNREQIFFQCINKMKKTTIYVLDNGLSKHHYFNIWKWTLKDFQKILGNHYRLNDYNEASNKYASTRILYPNKKYY